MEKHKEVLDKLLLNKTLKDIEFYDTDLEYISPDMDHTWIIDGGIQLQIENDYFTFAFTSEQDFFNTFPLKFSDLKNEFKVKSIGAKEVNEINLLIGTKIVKTEYFWNFYNELDENGEEYGERKYMPFEIIIYFSNNSFLQIAAVNYEIKNNKLADLTYDSECELLISINKKMQIIKTL